MKSESLEEDALLDCIFTGIDYLLKNNNMNALSTFIAWLHPEKIPTVNMVGILSATYCVRNELQARPKFLDACASVLKAREGHLSAHNLLKGLE